jgi:hypothetical protein
MDRIKTRMKETSESWVAMILAMMNLESLVEEAPIWASCGCTSLGG